ncbi:NF-kappa-B-repressing factor [Lingula anatina]|uniref:NF-kappa-B-repressing factor n=1 Tax=Lingula anatina TaxID=7574 RepID=A0A1S3JST7_LINAN|nr:NF-kappa-B-repressing factor [Lingula anatina]|eukprot:XP_013413387.1 NF-kappa-B-repressing factor [Lingula anatina]
MSDQDGDQEMVDLDQYKKEYENNKEWEMRRRFLECHWGKYPLERLLCLSQCFINIECMGCRYPAQVQAEVKALSEAMQTELSEHRAQRQELTGVKFVKSTLPGDQPVTEGQQSHTSSLGGPSVDHKQEELDIPSGSRKAKQTPLPCVTQGASETDQKFVELSNFVKEFMKLKKNAIETLHMAMDKTRMTSSCNFTCDATHGFQCEVLIDFVSVAKGVASSKKAAKHDAFENALKALNCRYLHVDRLNPERQELKTSDRPFHQKQSNSGMVKLGQSPGVAAMGMRSRKRSASQFSNPELEFFILEPKDKSNSVNPVMILRQSADFSKVPLEYNFQEDPAGRVRCRLFLGGELMADCMDISKNKVKLQAAQKTLDSLKEDYWTILVKQNEDCDDPGLTKEELLGDQAMASDKIQEDNIGNQLLRKMGWTGGGVGRGGQGRADPVTLSTVINREGLGMAADKGITKDFCTKVREIINKYVKSDNQNDLVFSPEFTKEERAIIHKESQKLGLKSHSHGQGEVRYLILSRKRSAKQLFTHIFQSGGVTSKYELVPPIKKPGEQK